jgi:pilus assembly protein Flp/PilA
VLNYSAKIRGLLGRLRNDTDGVVSFEYVIVAACIVAAVAAAFGSGGTGPIYDALSSAISTIAAKLTAAV